MNASLQMKLQAKQTSNQKTVGIAHDNNMQAAKSVKVLGRNCLSFRNLKPFQDTPILNFESTYILL